MWKGLLVVINQQRIIMNSAIPLISMELSSLFQLNQPGSSSSRQLFSVNKLA